MTDNLFITCHWPRRIEPTTLNFQDAIEHPDDLILEGASELPVALEVRRVVNPAGKFRGAKTMVENTVSAFADFNRQVRQNLTPWQAPPPKYKKRRPIDERPDLDIGSMLDNHGSERGGSGLN